MSTQLKNFLLLSILGCSLLCVVCALSLSFVVSREYIRLRDDVQHLEAVIVLQGLEEATSIEYLTDQCSQPVPCFY